jgi:aldehyde:ferredoxin oxidoreductase
VDLSSKIAYINLSNRQTKTVAVPQDLSRRFLGGRGIGGRLLADQLKTHVDALSPDNVIVVSVGLLDGMLCPGAAFSYVMSKSPLDGGLALGAIGGFFGAELRRAGFDHLVITGKASQPALILIRENKVRVFDASAVWGKEIPDAQEILRKQFEDDDLQTICIGPAGENLVKIAGVSTRYESMRVQSGIGAVFGSKNLKAIVAKGTHPIRIADPAAALECDSSITGALAASETAKGLQELGSSFLSTRSDDSFAEEKVGNDACLGCQVHCRRRFVIKRGPHAGAYGQIPAYPEDQAWKLVMGERDPEGLLYAAHVVDSTGLDTLETAALALRSDIGDDVAAFARRVARGELKVNEPGACAVLFDGALSQWQSLGMATANCGCDLLRFTAAYDPRRLPGPVLSGLLNKTVPFAGNLAADSDSSPDQARWVQNYGMVLDIMGICDYNSALIDPLHPGLEEFSRALKLNAGIEASPQELWTAAERAYAAERQFNLREGASNNSGKQGIQGLARYYELRGWDVQGQPRI